MKTQSGRHGRQNHKTMPPPRAAAPGPRGGLHPSIPWIGLALLAILVYLPALGGGFIWDDNALTDNPLVTSAGGLLKIWFAPRQMAQEQHYWPMVYTTFWLEHLAGGLNPVLYHLNNILLHAGVCLLLWRVLAALAVPGAWLGAALFAVHPVHAESVAWIIERKDVLSGVFYLGAALAFLRKAESDSQLTTQNSQPAKLSMQNAALILFAAALFSKSMAVTLPVALALVLWWRNGRLGRRELAALGPLAAVAAVLTLWDLHYYRGGQLAGFENSGLALPERFLLAGGSLWFYLSKLVFPWPLAPFYTRWTVALGSAAAWIPLAAWAGMLAGLWAARRRIGRGPFAAMAFFTLTLAPVLGIIDFDFLLFSWVADRFQYLASAGPLALAAAGLALLARRLGWPAAAARWGAAGVLGVLGVLCMAQSTVYHGSETLFRTAVARQPQSWAAYNNLGVALMQTGRGEEALKVLEAGLKATPGPEPQLMLSMADALAQQGQKDDAEARYQQLLKDKPRFAEAMIHYAAFLSDRRRYDEAVKFYRQALGITPKNAMALCNLGNILRQQDKLEEAEDALRQAVDITPGFAGFRVNLAQVLSDRSKLDEAVEQCLLALQTDPENLDGHFTLGQIYLNQGKYKESIEHLGPALRLQPDTPEILYFLGRAYEGLKDRAQATRYYQEVLRLHPNHPEAMKRLMGLNATPNNQQKFTLTK